MPAAANISSIASTPSAQPLAGSGPSSSTGSGDGFRDALEKASANGPETQEKAASNSSSTGAGQPAGPEAGTEPSAPGQAEADADASPPDASPATSGDADAGLNADPMAGNGVPPWLPLAGLEPPVVDAAAQMPQTPAGVQITDSDADPAMPAMLLQAMRQSPQAKPENPPSMPTDDASTRSTPTPAPVATLPSASATPTSVPAAATTTAEPSTDLLQTVAASAATSATTADAQPDQGALPGHRGEMPIELARLTGSMQGTAAHPTPTRGAEVAHASVPVPMSHPQWSDAFASRIAMQIRDGVQQVSLALNPAELGPVEVRLSVSDGQVSAQFHSAHQNVRQAIEDAMPRLREMLSQSGLNLADANVSQQAPRRDDQAAGGQGNRWSGSGDERQTDTGEEVTMVTSTRPLGLVDAYV